VTNCCCCCCCCRIQANRTSRFWYGFFRARLERPAAGRRPACDCAGQPGQPVAEAGRLKKIRTKLKKFSRLKITYPEKSCLKINYPEKSCLKIYDPELLDPIARTRGPFLTSPLAPRGEICPLREIFTPSFTPRSERSIV
jgi:hypothetical protein